MKEIVIIKEAIEKARRLAKESEALAVSLEILIEEDVDSDYEKDTAITEEAAAADIEAQDRERANAYKAETTTITIDELKAKAAEAAHAGHGDAIKTRLTELGVRKISELPEHDFSDFFAFLESLVKEPAYA